MMISHQDVDYQMTYCNLLLREKYTNLILIEDNYPYFTRHYTQRSPISLGMVMC